MLVCRQVKLYADAPRLTRLFIQMPRRIRKWRRRRKGRAPLTQGSRVLRSLGKSRVWLLGFGPAQVMDVGRRSSETMHKTSPESDESRGHRSKISGSCYEIDIH